MGVDGRKENRVRKRKEERQYLSSSLQCKCGQWESTESHQIWSLHLFLPLPGKT